MPVFRCLSLIFVLATWLQAQDQASTLSRLVDRSEVIAEVSVVAVTDPDALHHRVVFATGRRLKGEAPAVFPLTESAGNGCGQALHGMVPGMSMVAFLVWDGGGMRLTNPGSRCLPTATPVLVDHVRTLVGTKDRERVELLCAALSSPDPRVRRDAALTLPILAGLERADEAARADVLSALPIFLDRRDAAAAELLVAVARLRLQGAADVLVPRYLEGRDAGLAALMREAIAPLGDAAVRAVTASVPADSAGQERAVDLLSGVMTAEAGQALIGMLAGSGRAVRVRIASALLARGVQAQELSGLVGDPITRQARARLRTPPRYRSILRGDSARGGGR